MRSIPVHAIVREFGLSLFVITSAALADDSAEFSPPPLSVPDGFEIEIAAGPPLVKYPMMACLDERGRLFIAETRGQNLEKDDLLEKRGRFIRMLEDTDADGRFDKSTIFADQLVMPEGALWHQGSLFVLSSPYLWRFRDTDDDGVADEREKLVGSMEFNGKANQHGAYRGPNGRLYFSGGIFGYDLVGKDGRRAAKGDSAGVFSCRPDGTDVEVFGNGGVNPVEVAFTPEGELISTCAIFDKIDGRHDALIHWVRGGTATPKDFRPPVLKQTGYRLPALSRWGQVAPSGLMRYRGTAFGDRFQNTFFTAQFNTATVVNTRIERMGSTFRSFDEDFLTSSSEDFHPTDVLEDADGSLLVVDTGGWFLISCPESKVAKPNVLGAIYRVRRRGASRPQDPHGLSLSWEQAPSAQLAARLDDPRPFVRDRAIDTLSRRSGNEAVAALAGALGSTSVMKRRNAVWALSRIATEPAREALRRGLSDTDSTVRQAAVRSVGVLEDERAAQRLLEILPADTPPLRRAAATALGQIGRKDAVAYVLSAAANGGDDFLMHALVYALVEIGDFDGTLKGLESESPFAQHAALVALDQMAPDRLQQSHVAPLLETDDVMLRHATLKIVTSRDGWSDQIIAFLKGWLSGTETTESERAIARGAIIAFSGDKRMQALIHDALVSDSTTTEVRATVLESIGRVSELPAVWIDSLGRLLRTGESTVRLQTIAAVALTGTRKLDEELRNLAGNASTEEAVCAAAWSCLAGSGATLPDQAFRLLLRRAATQEMPPFERLDAARALSSAELQRNQLDSVADALPEVGPLELPVLIDAFKRTPQPNTELGNRLVKRLAQSPGLAGVSPVRLRAVFDAYPSSVRLASEPLLARIDADSESMSTRLSQVAEQLGAGNAEHGKAIFFSHRAACSACHRVGGEGGTIGPDLSQIGRIRKRHDLLEAILYPSASLVNDYETYSVVTTRGLTFQGVIQRATNDSIVLRNAQRQEQVIARDNIAELVRSKTSIMPQGLEKTIRMEELSDLLAYLESLRP